VVVEWPPSEISAPSDVLLVRSLTTGTALPPRFHPRAGSRLSPGHGSSRSCDVLGRDVRGAGALAWLRMAGAARWLQETQQ